MGMVSNFICNVSSDTVNDITDDKDKEGYERLV